VRDICHVWRMRQPSNRLLRYIQAKSTQLELKSWVSFCSPRALTLASAPALYFLGAGAFACVGRLAHVAAPGVRCQAGREPIHAADGDGTLARVRERTPNAQR
jgi:hypothetical protein